MKKFLLSIFAVLFAFAGAQAQSYVKVTSAPADWSGDYLIVYEAGKVAFNGSLTTLDAANNNVSVVINGNEITATDDTNAIKFTIAKSGTSYTIKSASGYYIGNTANSNKLNSSKGTEYYNTISLNTDASVQIVGSGGSILRYNANSGNYRFRYFKSSTYSQQKAIALYKYTESAGGDEGGDEVVKAVIPTLPESCYFEGSKTITITNNDENAVVYYSTDGKTFNRYTGSFDIDATTTVTAYAQIGEDEATRSSNVSATYKKVELMTIAEAKAAYDAAGADVEVVIDLAGAVVTANYDNGKYVFIQDDEAGIYVYGSGVSYPAGTMFTGGRMTCTSTLYSGLHEITNAVFSDVLTTTTTVEPIVVTVAELNANFDTYEGRYVKLEGVNLSGTTITQGEDVYAIYNRFSIALEDAAVCDVLGVVTCNIKNDVKTLQIFPTEIIPAAIVELPEVSVASGTTIEQGAEITITPAIDNVVTYSVNGAAAVEIDGETAIVANEIGEMTLVVTSTYGGETLTETYTYTVVAPIEKVTAMLTSEDIMAIGTSSSHYEDIEVTSACGVWTGLSYINKAGYLQLRSTEGEYIQSPIFPGRILSVTLTINNTNKRTFTVSDIDGNKLAENNNEGIAGEELLFNITSDVTAFKVESNGTTQISNIYVVYEKPADFQLSISEAGWATLYLGLDASIPTGVKCYTIAEDAVNAEYVTLSLFEGNVLPAHTAVIVEANKGVYTFEYADNYSGLLSGNLLKGSVTDEYVAGDAYVLGNKDGIGLYKAVLNKNEAGEVGTTHFKNNANKAYLPASVASGAASYSFRFGEGTTGIDEITDNRVQSTVIYDLTGRRVETITEPGIYIVGGKKVLVK